MAICLDAKVSLTGTVKNLPLSSGASGLRLGRVPVPNIVMPLTRPIMSSIVSLTPAVTCPRASGSTRATQRRSAAVIFDEIVAGLRVGLWPRLRLWMRIDFSASLTAAENGSGLVGGGGKFRFRFEFTLAGFYVGTCFTSSAFLNIVPGIGRSKGRLLKRTAAVKG